MGAYLEVWTPAGRELVTLEAERLTLGSDPANDLALPADPTLSRLHAALERYEAGWCVRDLGSRNGTFVNGQRVWRERPLRPGDELRVGATRLVYRGEEPGGKSTQASEPPPELTRREREVLLVLCRTVLGGAAFTEPASIREIADALVVSEAAVKQHLGHLYDKFGIHGGGERRRVQLANEALRRGGAVTIAQLREAGARDDKSAR
jgi:DNA-binding CsgD family transcriptional regulator